MEEEQDRTLAKTVFAKLLLQDVFTLKSYEIRNFWETNQKSGSKSWQMKIKDTRATEEGQNQRHIFNSSSHPAVFKDNF